MSWLDYLVLGILGLFALCSLAGLWMFGREIKRFLALRRALREPYKDNHEDD